MNLPDASRRTPATPPDRPARTSVPADIEALISFLIDRLREDLAEIWRRGDPSGPGRPGMAAQVDVVDDLLRLLAAGRLPARAELRMLLFGYGQHPEFDTRWNDHLRD